VPCQALHAVHPFIGQQGTDAGPFPEPQAQILPQQPFDPWLVAVEGVAQPGKGLFRNPGHEALPEGDGAAPLRRHIHHLVLKQSRLLLGGIGLELRLFHPVCQGAGEGADEPLEAAVVAIAGHHSSPVIGETSGNSSNWSSVAVRRGGAVRRASSRGASRLMPPR
jgi:hypothetical protein